MEKDEFRQLMEKYLQESITVEEMDRLWSGLQSNEDLPAWEEAIEAILKNPSYHGYSEAATMKEVFQKIMRENNTSPAKQGRVVEMTPKPNRPVLRMMAAAAIILLLLGTGSYFLFFNKANDKNAGIGSQPLSKNDIAPGGNKATLTLGNGSTIILDSAVSGTLALQGNSRIIKSDSGALFYQKDPGTRLRMSTEPVYNVLTTPRGGQYQLALSDGTKVWLNSNSSLRYATVFAGKVREVEMTGEAYFEVAHNATMPFIVKTNGQQVLVLGTHFNINAYTDESSIRTTLLEGSVQVTNSNDHVVIGPGEQTQLTNNGNIEVIKGVDVDDAVAWKNGFFSFRQADIHAVMRQLSRWYDMDVQYQGHININEAFSGEIDRNLSLSDVLNGLKLASIHYRIEEDRKLVILP
jgi:transmembrane sensor